MPKAITAEALPMHLAPEDGTRILLHYITVGYNSTQRDHIPNGHRWEEAYYDVKGKTWRLWAGNPSSMIIPSSIGTRRLLEWLPLPISNAIVGHPLNNLLQYTHNNGKGKVSPP